MPIQAFMVSYFSIIVDRIHKRINKNDYAEWNTIFKIVKIDG